MEKQELTILDMNILRFAGGLLDTTKIPEHERVALDSATKKLCNNQVIMQMEAGVEYDSVEHVFKTAE